jgi:hypothetical protein
MEEGMLARPWIDLHAANGVRHPIRITCIGMSLGVVLMLVVSVQISAQFSKVFMPGIESVCARHSSQRHICRRLR